jgi:hypothetical protein
MAIILDRRTPAKLPRSFIGDYDEAFQEHLSEWCFTK